MNYEEFKREFYKISQLDLSSYKESQMKRRIDTIIKRNQCHGYDDYLILIKGNKQKYDEFLEYLTINVSDFFRNPNQWKVLDETIIPELLKTKRHLKIWSAACSSGQEPYSLAMLLNKHLPLSSFSIIATDYDKEILKKAQAGIYDLSVLKDIPECYHSKWIIKRNNEFEIKPELKRCITFKQHNLLKDPYPQDIDLIVCRNVLIYFTEDAKASIYHKFHQSLSSNGILFVGNTEQIIPSETYGFKTKIVFFYEKSKK